MKQIVFAQRLNHIFNNFLWWAILQRVGVSSAVQLSCKIPERFADCECMLLEVVFDEESAIPGPIKGNPMLNLWMSHVITSAMGLSLALEQLCVTLSKRMESDCIFFAMFILP